MTHSLFVVSAYGFTFAALIIFVVWTYLSHRKHRA